MPVLVLCPDTQVLPGDCDGDGIPDEVEQATGTAPRDPDSDCDGLCDGGNSVADVCQAGEDLNNNGQVDPGETDPSVDDSGGDGCNAPIQIGRFCSDDRYASITAQDATTAASVLALPSSFPVPVAHAEISAVTFSDPTAGVFGYVIAQDTTKTLDTSHTQNQALIDAVNTRTEDSVVSFVSWLNSRSMSESPDTMSSRGSFEYGVGAANPDLDSKDPAALRDEIIAAITGTAFDSGDVGEACTRVIHHHVTRLRADGTLISAGAVICESNSNDSANFLEGLSTVSVFAPGGGALTFLPEIKQCDVFTKSQEPYALAGYPILTSLQVSIRIGEEDIQVHSGYSPDVFGNPNFEEPYWLYDAETNSIELFNIDPTSEYEMVTAYRSWELRGG